MPENGNDYTLETVIFDALATVRIGMGVEEIADAIRNSEWLDNREQTSFDEGYELGYAQGEEEAREP